MNVGLKGSWRSGHSKREGISSVVGMLIVLIILIAVLIPFTYLVLSLPSSQSTAADNAQAINSVATSQKNEVVVIESSEQLSTASFLATNHPVYYGLVYSREGGILYVLLLQNAVPSPPLEIKTILGYNGARWVVVKSLNEVVNETTADHTFNGFKAAAINVGSDYEELMVETNFGNLIPVTPYESIPLPLAKETAGIVYLQPKNFIVVQQPKLVLLSQIPGISSNKLEDGVSLVYLAKQIGNSFTVSCAEIVGLNGEFHYVGYYQGVISSNPLSFSLYYFNGTLDGSWQVPPYENIISPNGSYNGSITLPAPFFETPINVSVKGYVNAVVNGSNVTLTDFLGNVTLSNKTVLVFNGSNKILEIFPNGTNSTLTYRGSYEINATNMTSIEGKGLITFTNSQVPVYSFGLYLGEEYVTAMISGYLNGSITISNNNNFIYPYGEGEFNGPFEIQTNSVFAAAGFSEFSGIINATMSPDYIPFGYSATLSLFINSTSENNGYIKSYNGLEPWVEEPLVIRFNFAIANPSNYSLKVYYGYLFFKEQFVLDFLMSSGSKTGQESGYFLGDVQFNLPNGPLLIPPSGLVNETVQIAVPLQINFFNPQAYSAFNESINNENQFVIYPQYEELTIEFYTNVGYLASSTFYIPVQQPITVQAQQG
ncbi:MAG: hypothetical protein MPF33_02275 [Candidatus Aramenus sp.]|jgi:hypothetical protein|nr:hypothetical protein [Candidatus Aramenus sp.]